MKLSVIVNLPTTEKITNTIEKLKEAFPEITKITEEFHATIAVADDVDESKIDEIKEKIKPIIAKFRSELKIGPIDSMENHNGEGVLFADIVSDNLEDVHWEVRELLESYGGKFTYPDFVAHMTLGYLPKLPDKEQRAQLAKIELSEKFNVSSKDVHISIKTGDDWERIAMQLLSKRVC